MRISFPHLGDYHAPLSLIAKRIFPHASLILPPPITVKTIELGAKYSPDFVCMPFKYNLGNFIEALELGADTLMCAGAGCRYGFYGELHELILRDLGYKFDFVNFFDSNKSVVGLYGKCRNMGSNLSLPKFLLTAKLVVSALRLMDTTDAYIREHQCLEQYNGTLSSLRNDFLVRLPEVENNRQLWLLSRQYRKALRDVRLRQNVRPIRIGIVGELFSLMEHTSSHFIESELIRLGFLVTRHINLSYLLFHKKRNQNRLLKDNPDYIKYHLGADATETVIRATHFAMDNYDAIIHLKPFGCTPELNAIPFLTKISSDYRIPILYFSFDTQTSKTGITTRLEAFADMLHAKRQAKDITASAAI